MNSSKALGKNTPYYRIPNSLFKIMLISLYRARSGRTKVSAEINLLMLVRLDAGAGKINAKLLAVEQLQPKRNAAEVRQPAPPKQHESELNY